MIRNQIFVCHDPTSFQVTMGMDFPTIHCRPYGNSIQYGQTTSVSLEHPEISVFSAVLRFFGTPVVVRDFSISESEFSITIGLATKPYPSFPRTFSLEPPEHWSLWNQSELVRCEAACIYHSSPPRIQVSAYLESICCGPISNLLYDRTWEDLLLDPIVDPSEYSPSSAADSEPHVILTQWVERHEKERHEPPFQPRLLPLRAAILPTPPRLNI